MASNLTFNIFHDLYEDHIDAAVDIGMFLTTLNKGTGDAALAIRGCQIGDVPAGMSGRETLATERLAAGQGDWRT